MGGIDEMGGGGGRGGGEDWERREGVKGCVGEGWDGEVKGCVGEG